MKSIQLIVFIFAFFSMGSLEAQKDFKIIAYTTHGNAIGVKLRPIFFPNEKPQPEKLTGC